MAIVSAERPRDASSPYHQTCHLPLSIIILASSLISFAVAPFRDPSVLLSYLLLGWVKEGGWWWWGIKL